MYIHTTSRSIAIDRDGACSCNCSRISRIMTDVTWPTIVVGDDRGRGRGAVLVNNMAPLLLYCGSVLVLVDETRRRIDVIAWPDVARDSKHDESRWRCSGSLAADISAGESTSNENAVRAVPNLENDALSNVVRSHRDMNSTWILATRIT